MGASQLAPTPWKGLWSLAVQEERLEAMETGARPSPLQQVFGFFGEGLSPSPMEHPIGFQIVTLAR